MFVFFKKWHGSHMEYPIYLSYDQLDAWLMSQAPAIQNIGAVRVVGVLRGGAFPAISISHLTGLPVSFMSFDRVTGEARWASSEALPQVGSCVLLCEDFAGSGVTLSRCESFLIEAGLDVKVLTLCFDAKSRKRPDFYMDMGNKKAVLPWERHTLSRKWDVQLSALKSGLGKTGPDHVYERWGFDLDGVFLPDVAAALYESDLEKAIATRHEHVLHPGAPKPPEDAVFITGRPEQDRALTEKWLSTHGLGGHKLIMRDTRLYDARQTHLHKAAAALREGITHFLESEAEQAAGIAREAPWLRVMLWNVDRGEASWVVASSADLVLSRLRSWT